MRAHFCWNSENKHWGWHELVFSTCFMYPLHLEMSIQERKCKFSKTVNFTEHPICARHYTRARDLKTRTWAPARCLGNGCWLCCCCETGREKEIPLSSCKIAQHLWVVSWSEHLLFQTRDGKATMRAFWVSRMLLRVHNLDQLWNVANQGVGLFHYKHSHMPSLQFDISAVSASFKSQVRHVVCVELGTKACAGLLACFS